jgi:hypothetical protein
MSISFKNLILGGAGGMSVGKLPIDLITPTPTATPTPTPTATPAPAMAAQLWVWGYNYEGQLGDSTTISKS